MEQEKFLQLVTRSDEEGVIVLDHTSHLIDVLLTDDEDFSMAVIHSAHKQVTLRMTRESAQLLIEVLQAHLDAERNAGQIGTRG